MQLRLSPSGPIVGDIGTGFILKRKTVSLPAEGSLLLLVTDLPLGSSYLEMDVAAASAFQIQGSAMFDGHEANTNNMQMAVQYSNDAGANWADVDRCTQEVPGAAPACAGLFRLELETDPVLGSDLLPVNTAAGTVRFRLVANWGGAGSTALRWSSGVAAVGQLGTTQINGTEQLP